VNLLKDIHRSAWLTPASHIFLAVLLTFALFDVNAAEPVDDSKTTEELSNVILDHRGFRARVFQ
jgi:hypothetical protein